MQYNSIEIEKKWRKYWQDNNIYRVENDPSKPKFYVLDMFPYPSGAGLHVGHPLGYIASDITSRYKRMNGFNVLHPMGYDAFGLPAEQYAIQMGVHPAVSTNANIERYRRQMDNIGFSFDWSRQVSTSDPNYYKWTQWLFIQLFEHYYDNDQNKSLPIADLIKTFETAGSSAVNAAESQEDSFSADEWNGMTPKEKDVVLMNYRLAYRKVSYVNWCEELGTILANDEVKDGISERGGFPVTQKAMMQWSLRTTAYAEQLLNDLDTVAWSDSLKMMQRNWIGRSEGAEMKFKIDGHDTQFEVFTTRPDTIFGATFMVLAPEHDLVAQITTADQRAEIDQYLAYVKTRSERDRMTDVKEVTGAFTGAYAINPFDDTKVPIYIADYVLKDYGTGAIMAVPSDDERDKRFAKKFGIEIIDVVDKTDFPGATLADKVGKMINSDLLNGMEVKDAIEKMLSEIESRNLGTRQINYKLRDANYGRQRYWGEPFPIIYDADGVAFAVPESELPVELPHLDDVDPGKGGKSPLSKLDNWVNLENGFTRETDTMPGFAGSSWYFLRYMDPDNNEEFAAQSAIRYWEEVDLYVGGTEHAVGHLMYSRFFHKFLYDKGLVPTKEPFKKLINQGMIQGVIENLFLIKEKTDGRAHFISAPLIKAKGLKESEYTTISVYVSYITNYGTPDSYLSAEGVKKFTEWRPEYANAIFESKGGTIKDGVLASNGNEPFKMVTQSEVGKMSKRYYNVINPDDVVAEYGADCFRMYEMFLGPVEQSKPWDMNGIDGVSKFVRKLWAMFYNETGEWIIKDAEASKEENKILHICIKRVTEDIERFSFNTCVSHFMICINELRKVGGHKAAIMHDLLRILAPFAPFITEELWAKLGQEKSIHLASFPTYDESFLVEDSIDYPVCINGKKRASLNIDAKASNADMEKAALEIEAIQKWIEGKEIRKVIVVPKRMINIVV